MKSYFGCGAHAQRSFFAVLAVLAVPAIALLVALGGSSAAAGQSDGPNGPNPPYGLFVDDRVVNGPPSSAPGRGLQQPGGVAAGGSADQKDTATASIAAAAIADAAVPVGTMPSGVAATNTRAYVANAQSNNVSVIDLTLATPSVIATIPVGLFPVGVALSADGSQAYVTNYNAGTLSIISTATNTVTNTVTVGSRPNGVLRVGASVYVANLTGNSIMVVNPVTATVVNTVTLGGSPAVAPSGLATNAAGSRLYASDARNGKLVVLNLSVSPPAILSSTTTVGAFPAYLSVAGTTGYVANPGSNSVSVVNLAVSPPTVTATVAGLTADYGIVAQPALDQVLVTNSGANTVSVVNTTTNTVVGTFPTGTKPNAIVLTPDGTTAIVSNQGANTVSVLHVNQKPVNTVPGAQTVNANGTGSSNKKTFSPGNANAISTTDDGTPVQVTVTTAHGNLTLSTVAGLSVVSGNGTHSVSLTGPSTAINTALNGMTYTPDTGYRGADTLTLTTNDQGNTGIGRVQTDTDTVAITVQNVAPTVGAVGPFSGAVGNTIFGVGTTPAQPSTNTAGNALTNSSDANNDPISAVAGTITTTNGGTVTMSANGTFTYITAAGGALGNDTFTFQVSDGITTSSGTATVTVANRAWYVNNALGVNGTGRSTSPYNTLASLQGGGDLDAAGDYIFLYQGNAAYAGGLVLEANQKLFGQPQGLVINAVTLVPASGANPVITNSAGTGITLASGVTIRRVNVANTSSAGINGSSIADADIGPNLTVSGSGGAGFAVFGAAAGNITFAGNITHSSAAGRSVFVAGRSGGTVTISGSVTDTAGGVQLNGNTGATINLTGGLTISGGNEAFKVSGGGTVTVTGTNTLSAIGGAGAALSVTDTTIGASGLTFQSVSGNGGQNGIVLSNTGAGGLTVTGTGTAGSGGTIQNSSGADGATTGIGIYLNNASNVSLSRMNLQTFTNFAILGNNVNNFTLAHSTINGTNGDNAGIDEASVAFTGLTGVASINNTVIQGGIEDNVRVVNAGGTLNRLTFDTVTIGPNSAANGNDGISLEGTAGTFNVTVQNSTFTSAAGDLFQHNALGTVASNLVFKNNALSNNHSAISGGGGGVTIAVGGSGDLTYDIDTNTLRGAKGSAIVVNKAFGVAPGDGTATGKIRNNTIGVSGVANSGSSEGSGIHVGLLARGVHTTLIDNNKIYRYTNHGIFLQAGGSAQSVTLVAHDGDLNATIQNNIIAEPNAPGGGLAQNGIHLNSGTNSGGGNDNYDVCLAFSANTLTGSGALTGEDYRLRQRFDTDVRLPGYTGAADGSGLAAYLAPLTTGAFTLGVTNTATGGFLNTAGGAACPAP